MDKTVAQLVYRRVTAEETERCFREFFKAAEHARSAEEVIAARSVLVSGMKEEATARSLCNYRYSMDVRDPFYQAETAYYDEALPRIHALYTRYYKVMLASPFRKELEKKLGGMLFRLYEVSVRAHDEACIAEEQEENALTTAYSKCMSSMLFSWEGDKIPLSVLRGKLSDRDKEVRFAAAEAIGKGLREHAEELDTLYDRLVHVRHAIACKMGYKNFTQVGYSRLGRTSFDAAMAERFRANVLESFVPAVSRLKEGVRSRLGLDVMRFSDNDVYLKEGAPAFTLGIGEAFRAAQEMYDEMDAEIGAFFARMVRSGAFDVAPREGKCGGGFCDDLPKYDLQVILANFNGTTGDVDVLTHEFGHAYAMHACTEAGADYEVGIGGMETAECHSMSMEFLCEKYMDKFFGGRAADYCCQHLADALSFIPYGCIVDEFQHRVYEEPSLTPAERNKLYLALEQKYRPWLTYEGIPYLEEGTRWQYQGHIFESPFYYLDYCLAQTVSLGFFTLSRRSHAEALARYKQFARSGGMLPFGSLVARAGLADPFSGGTLGSLAAQTEDILAPLLK